MKFVESVAEFFVNAWANEPVAMIGIVDAAMVVGVTFGLPLTPDQKGGIDALLQAVAFPFARSQVTPVKKQEAAAAATLVVPTTSS